MLAETRRRLCLAKRLDLKVGVAERGARISAIRMDMGRIFEGRMFSTPAMRAILYGQAGGVSYLLAAEAP